MYDVQVEAKARLSLNYMQRKIECREGKLAKHPPRAECCARESLSPSSLLCGFSNWADSRASRRKFRRRIAPAEAAGDRGRLLAISRQAAKKERLVGHASPEGSGAGGSLPPPPHRPCAPPSRVRTP